MEVDQIVRGFLNQAMNKEVDLYESRMKICRECKLYKPDGMFGEQCNSKLYLNPETNKISTVPKPGYKNGCGCSLKAKTRVKQASCPLNK